MKNKVISILLAITLCSTIAVTPAYAAELPQEEYAEEAELVLDGLAEPEEELSVVGLTDGMITAAETSSDVSAGEMIARALEWKRGGKSVVMDDAFLGGVSSTATDWDALALGRLGVEENYGGFRSAAASYVAEKYAQDPKYGLSTNTATEWHRLTVALLASGGDPLNVGGQNLIKDGVYECKVGAPWKQGTNGAIWALIALDSFGYEVPEGASYDREDLIQYLLDNEKSGGGWALSAILGADADITAMAVQALAPYYAGNVSVKAAVDRGLDFLRSCQNEDGDVSSSMGGRSSEATCQTILAFCSMGQDPETVVSENGKTLIDGLRKYENQADGGFYHDIELADKGSDGMATQQALYTLAGYQRYQQGKTNLYDFRADAKTAQYRIKAGGKTYRADAGSTELQLPLGTKKMTIENLPIGNYESAVIEAGGKTYQSSYRRADGSTPVEEEIPIDAEALLVIRVTDLSGNTQTRTFKVTADGEVDDASAAAYVEEQIDALPEADKLTLADEKEVAEARKAYDELTEAQKTLVKNTEKLTGAEKKIAELKAAADAKLDADRKALKKKIDEIRTPVKISQKKEIQQYLQELDELGEWSEKEALKKKLNEYIKTITARETLVAQLDEDIWNQIRPLHLSESDTMTVKALMKRYRALSQEEQKLLKNEQSLLDANDFINNLEEEDAPKEIRVKGTKKTTVTKITKPTVKKTTKTAAKSNLVKSPSKSGIVSKSEFEKVQGKDENLQVAGLYGAQLPYTFTFYGKDINKAADFNYLIQTQCDHATEIGELAEEPFLLCMEKTGPFPGEALLTMKTNLKDGAYLLFVYDSDAMKAEYVKKLEVSDGETMFTLSEGGDYFIAKRAKSGSLKSQKDETEKSGAASGAEDAEWDESKELAVSGTAVPAGQMALSMLLGAAIMAIGVFLGYMLGKNKNSSKEDEEEWEE